MKNVLLLIAVCLLTLPCVSGAFALDRIAASQLGFTPGMKKQFSSPVPFVSFEIQRVSDGAAVYSGGAPIRRITSSIIGGDTVWIGDFSTFTAPGRFRIAAGAKESYPFTISAHIFDQPLRAAQRFFYYQRAFTAVEMPYAEGPWVHPSDIDKAPAGVTRGWHDAGNYPVYMPTMTQSIFWMLEAWSDFRPLDDDTNIPESGNGIPDLLDETRWGVEWVVSMQDSGGGFWGSACPGCNDAYTYGTATPNNISPYCKAAHPTVQNTAKAVAVLAYAAAVFAPYDTAFANACLRAAESGWLWMEQNPAATDDSGPCASYQQGADAFLLRTNRMWAASGLLYATGLSVYEAAFENDAATIDGISSFNRSDGFAGSLYLRAPAGTNETRRNSIEHDILAMADNVRSDANAHPFQFATAYYWGCTSNGMHRSGQFSWRAFMLDTTRAADLEQGLYNLDYIFGRNYYNQCYLSGTDGVSKPRVRGFHEWMKVLDTTPWHFPGALAGGPNQSPETNDISYAGAVPYPIWGYWGDPANPRGSGTPVDGRFTDNDSWSTNEVAINWNAALLYNLYAARSYARGESVTSVAPGPPDLPTTAILYQNYPNPFNPATEIRYALPKDEYVVVTVLNVLGQLVSRVIDAHEAEGYHSVQLDARNLPSGVYFCRLQAGAYVSVKKLVLMR